MVVTTAACALCNYRLLFMLAISAALAHKTEETGRGEEHVQKSRTCSSTFDGFHFAGNFGLQSN